MGLLEQNTEEVVEGSGSIELSFYPKDSQGRIMGKKKTITGDGFKIWRGWMNNNGPGIVKGKKKKKKTSSNKKTRYKEVLPKGKQAEALAKEAAQYAEKKQKERELPKQVTNANA